MVRFINPVYLFLRLYICFLIFGFSCGFMRDYYNSLFRPMSLNKAKVETLGSILKSHVQKLRDTKNRKVDLVFLVDSSASVGATNFFDELKFVRKLLADFTVDINATRVSVITFSSRGKVIRHVDHLTRPKTSNQKCGLLAEEMPKIRYIGGGTYTLGAFIEAKNVLKAARYDAAKAIFLITDGFSNGGDPRPEASALRDLGVAIFTFGIRNGNVRELYDMSSEPRNETCYILDSFEEFEALARRALHEDLHSGSYMLQSKASCSMLCTEGRDCCHPKAGCMCGTHTGKYECLCQPGYYGHGLGKTGCAPCPANTYKNYTGAGDISSCIPCPDDNHQSGEAATHIAECTCRKGYHNTTDTQCAAYRCSMLEPPVNGYFVNNKCNNVFNAACGLRCRPGYELRGSSLRICQDDSTWSGTTTECIMKTCPPLSIPKHGHMICSRDDFTYSTECRFTCDNGFKLVGSRKRTCLAIALWTGITTRCREITCQPLPSLRDGTITPASCTEGEVLFGTTCQMTCTLAYTLYGPNTKQCTPDGNWAPPSSKPNQCIDDKPPFIQCPKKLVVEADSEEPDTEVSWQIPLAVDNSGLIPTTIAIPALVPPAKLPIGYTEITYIAEDWNKNKAKCKVYIHIVDKTPPRVDYCASPKAVVSSQKYGNVSWKEPVFTDNSEDDLQIVQSHKPGLFSLGKTKVTYTAIDKSGNNNTCVLEINVIPHPCEFPDPPVNGNRTCFENEEGVICKVFCMDGYAFAIPPANEYFCAYDDVWRPENQMPFPDCSVKQISNDLVQEASFTFTSKLSCRDRNILNKIKSKFKQKVTNRINEICVGEIHCTLQELETTCEENADFNKVKVSFDKRRKRSVNKVKKQTIRKTFLTFEMKLEGSVNATGNSGEDKKSQKKLEKTLKKVLKTLQNDAENGSFDLQTLGRKIFYNGMDVENDVATFQCPDGKVLLSSDCINCPVGTFFNIVHRECQSCLKGTYQEAEGEITCLVCPNKTSTSANHSRSEGECLAQCLPGSFSSTGLERCETCSIGWYQPEYYQTSCLQCPPGLTTARRGGRTRQDCKEICPRGYVSKNGLEPCFACPRGTFQPDSQKSACFECPNNASTYDIASISLTDCEGDWDLQSDGTITNIQNQQQQLSINSCFENPCINGGTCVPKSVSFSCKCPPGFGGVVCQSVLDECKSKPCLNNGTCSSLPGDYQCTCVPGFTGKKCETNIDECISNPCLYNGICIDGINTYKCNCPDGYQGVRCDSQVNDCSDDPCRNGGTCEDLLDGYKCKCTKGFNGLNCEVEEDECLSSPCRNNATCQDLPGDYSCTCIPGYTGKRCGRDINECKPDPCQNNAKCEDLVNGFKCHCLPGYRGDDCSRALDVNYQLDFAAPSVVDRAQIVLPPKDLSSITVSFWMKSDDQLNFGTPYSYAVPGLDNAFTLTDYNGFAVLVNQEKRVTDVVANDGYWHHIVVKWSSNRGAWAIYQDGLIVDSGWDLSTGRPVAGGGIFIIGQEQDSVGGGFSSSESFVGSLTHLNVWDYELNLDAIDDMRITCNKYQGNVLAWPDIYPGLRGTLSDSPSTFCQECPEPIKPDFGDVTYTNLTYGSTASYSCLRGFNVDGFRDQLCLVTGEWEAETPLCAKVDCGYPGNIRNGHTEGRRYTFDNRVRYHCYKGYELVGPKTRYCNEYGEWEGDKPKCVEITCELPLLSVNTVVANPKSKYVNRDVVLFSCTPGNIMQTPHASVKCQADGTWDKSVPTCDLLKCGSPPKINEASPKNPKKQYSVGEHVIYECGFGYTLSVATAGRKGKLSCLPTGQWETNVPECVIVTCPEIPLVANADKFGDEVIYLSSVEYVCHPGYKMSGDDTIECYENGEWTPEPPDCRPVSCQEPPPILHGRFTGPSYTLNSIVTYQCDAGYRLNAEPRRRCLENSSWSGIQRECKPVECPQPDKIENGGININSLLFQSIISYICNEGYELFGSKERSCLETAEWSSSKPECKPVNCGPPPDIFNGNMKGMPPYVFQISVYYTCNEGFDLIGESNLTCESNAAWSSAGPTCDIITCPNPASPANGFVNALGLTYSSKAEYECQQGYVLEGESSRVCQLNRQWSSDEPKCRPTQCPPPDNITNGVMEFKDRNIDAIVSYSCNIGYLLVGDEVRQCQDTLTWSGQRAECLPVRCNGSLSILNGRVEITTRGFGDLALYTCDEGYNLVGDGVKVCDQLGNWAGEDMFCQIVECDKTASVISNGKMEGDNFTFGSLISYTCDDGYTMLGSSTRVCDRNGEWDAPLPACQIVQCPSFILANGYTDGFKRDFNSVVTYSCKRGFKLVGPQSRTCLSGGVWEGEDPICTKITCPTLPNLDFGSFSALGSLKVTYQCDEGYNLIGQPERTCLNNGTWSGIDPRCELVTCPDLSNLTLPNGYIRFNRTTYSSVCKFICNDGYELEGSSGAVCQANGTWSSQVPTCKIKSCGEPGAVLNGLINGTIYTYGARLYYSCLEGFQLVGSPIRTCGPNSLWIEPTPRCEQIVCPDLPDIDYGSVTIQSNTPKGIAKYVCIPGYELFGTADRECLTSGEWADQDPVCAPIHCHHPRALQNGDIKGTDYHFQKQITYECNEGYYLDGNSVRTCTESGLWSGRDPSCNRIRCEDPRVPDHGRIIGSSYYYNDTITYVCDEGFRLNGGSTRLCTINWVWNISAATCERVRCGVMPAISHATIIGNSTFFNTSNSIACDTGYKPNGDPQITCMADGEWFMGSFSCVIVSCPAITSIQHGSVIGDDFTYDQQIYFSCDVGYDLIGTETVKCLSSGNWDNQLPYCSIVVCPVITPLVDGKTNTTSNSYGTVVQYRCNRGYQLTGSSYRTCLDYGEWDIDEPTCDIKTCPTPLTVLKNGYMVNIPTEYVFNTSIEYQCDDGYEMLGNSRLTCGEDGNWDSDLPVCAKIKCPKPGGLDHGRVSGSEDVITYFCNDGYILQGSSKRTCTASAQWDVDPPYCEAVACPIPIPIPNGQIYGNNFTHGNQIEYICFAGYNLVGEEDRNCLASGEWDKSSPSCELVSCGQPADLQNGQIFGMDYTFGQNITFICDDGYNLIGSNFMTCQDDGSWSSVQPKCERIVCEMLPIENGFIRNPPSVFYAGSSILYECDPDYQLRGSAYIDCTNNGTILLDTLPTCSLVLCPPVTGIDNGNAVGSEFRVGRTIVFTCNPDFQLSGESEIMCLPDGSWTDDPPVCKEITCPSPANIVNGYSSDYGGRVYRVSDIVMYLCNPGFELIGYADIQCGEDGLWSDPSPTCDPISCPTPPIIANGILKVSGYRVASRAVYDCTTGYTLAGNNVLECGIDGSWIGEIPACRKKCGAPPQMDNASTQVITSNSIKTATYTCDRGYSSSSDITATCDQSGNWVMQTNHVCQPVYCLDPPTLQYGNAIFTQTTVGSEVVYTCDIGYNMDGSDRLVCDDTGSWYGAVPRCIPVNCGPPPSTQRYTGSDFRFGREVEYQCDTGYTMLGEAILICQANGQWSGIPPACARISCGPLNVPQFGKVIQGDPRIGIFFNDVVEFACDDGHVLAGEAVFTCMSNSRWSSQPPSCEPVLDIKDFCDTNVQMKNTKPIQLGYMAGDSAIIKCQDGFYGDGDMNTRCLKDGSWNIPTGRCKRIYCGRPRVRDMMNVVILGLSYFYGDQVRYLCRPGLNPTRYPPVITCTASGMWDGDATCAAQCKLPCNNGGMCIGMNRCKCRPGYGGTQCEIPICILPCLNGGVCSAPYRCSCPEGYTGSRCHKANCPVPCENGGRCIRPHKCKCYNGFQPPHCKTKLLERR